MKFIKKEALKIKYDALYWLRIKQRCAFIATECGNFSADVLGINEKKIIEIEVKTNLADFKNDFKKPKHQIYNGTYGLEWNQQWIPTHFYYMMPEEFIEDARKILEEKGYKRYGIINSKDLSVIKRAGKLHDREPNSHVKFIVALRMGSELLRFHEAWL
jgi:hypothetical protein